MTAVSFCLFKQIQVWNFSSSLISATYKAYLIFNEEAQPSLGRLWNVTGAPSAVQHSHSFVRFTMCWKGGGQVAEELRPESGRGAEGVFVRTQRSKEGGWASDCKATVRSVARKDSWSAIIGRVHSLAVCVLQLWGRDRKECGECT